jgi:ribosomal protein S18 acetylase RimI-like enzyme
MTDSFPTTQQSQPNRAPTIRPATPSDLDAIVRLHVAVWRDTYRDLVSPDIAQKLDVGERRPRWAAMLRRDGTMLAETEAGLAGFAQVAPREDPVFGGRAELRYLYVDRAQARRGIGRRLLGAAAHYAMARGHRGLGLGVVVGNDPAIVFYEALGGRRAGFYTDPGPTWRSDNHVYVWDDLPGLVDRTAARGG